MSMLQAVTSEAETIATAAAAATDADVQPTNPHAPADDAILPYLYASA